MAPKHPLGENLRNIRKSKGLTQSELAARMFITTQAISKWERGESDPSIQYIHQLTNILGVTSDALLGIHPDAVPALLAIDGGGTKTEFVLISTGGQLLKRILLPGANPNSSSVENSFRVLCTGIGQMLQTEYQIVGIYIGCAGMGSGNNGVTITKLLGKEFPGISIKCESDILNLLACAKDPENAIAVISGTGSVVYATVNGRLIRAGGGGWMLDPMGSGYELGRAALASVLAHTDGTGPATDMTNQVEKQLGSSVWNSISKIYNYTPAQIARFAPIVIQAWESGDKVASGIVTENAQRLADLIRWITQRSPNAQDILLGGSLLTCCQSFRDLVIGLLPDNLTVNPQYFPPVWGACLRCAKLCNLPQPSVDTFLKDYKTEIREC